MKISCIVILLALLCVWLLGIDVYAQEERIAVAVKVGTLGVGAEGIARINSKLNAKLGVNAFQYDFSDTESDIEYDMELELLSFSALIDWFPSENGFRITGGLLVSQNSLDLDAQTTATYEIGDTTYTAAQVGSLTGELDFNDVCPYIGFGWGNPFGEDESWLFLIDFGVMFQGSPEVDLNANGALANNAAFMADLAREQDNLENKVDEYEFYPVVSLGVAYRF